MLDVYNDQFYSASYPHDKAIVSIAENSKDKMILESIKVNARIPRYIYSSGTLPIFISVTNNGNEIINDLGVYFVSDNMFPLILKNQYNNEILCTGMVFDEVAPHSTVIGRLSLVTQTNTTIGNVSIVVGESHEERQPEGNVARLIGWSWKTLQHSFIELILLPPWSNGVILALALFASYLSPSKDCGTNEDDEPEPFKSDWWKCVWDNLKGSAWILLVMIILIVLFMYGVLFILSLDFLLIWMIIKAAQKPNDYCKVFGFVVIALAFAIICDNPTLPLLLALVKLKDIPPEALWMDILSVIGIIESIVLIMLCAKIGTTPGIAPKGGKIPHPPSPPVSLQSPIPSLPAKPLPPPNKSKMGKKEKERKKINKFETYDLRVEQRIRKEWGKIKKRKDMGAEELALREFAMQLKTKRYEKTDDWVWVLRNFFRARPERLQGLLFEISERIADLDEIKKTEQEKPVEPEKPKRRVPNKRKETSVPISPSLGDDGSKEQGVNKLPQRDLGEDTDQNGQTKNDNPPSIV